MQKNMKHTLSILVFVGILNVLYSEELRENNQEVLPLAVIPTKENQPGADGETARPELSSSDLSEIEELAKNISHSKGIYREGVEKKELRRSVIKKATVSAESDIVKELLLMFQSAEDKMLILKRIEDLVHQYDVAITFATMGGMKILSQFLYSNDDDIVSAVAIVLGSAMQSNPDVQKIAMDEEVGKKLFQLLNHKSPYVVPRIVFAISSFLRNAPKAQEEFLLANGVSRFADILKTPFITADTKLKIVDLFNDLAIEQKTAKDNQKGRSNEQIEVLQRLFATETYKNNICEYIPLYLELEDYDSHQRIVDAMLSLDSVCKDIFRLDIVKDRLKELLKIYYPGNSGKNYLYPYIDEELRETLYSRLVVLYEKVNDGANVSSYKYFSNKYSFKIEL